MPANSIVMGAPGGVKRTRNNACEQSDFLVRASPEQRRLAALYPDATSGSG